MEKKKLLQEILKARTMSWSGEATISDPEILIETDFSEIRFCKGEIESATIRGGRNLKRGMVVRVSSRYTGNDKVAVIIGFSFGETQFPVMISMGGAEGELHACVRVGEISLFPPQTGDGKAVVLKV